MLTDSPTGEGGPQSIDSLSVTAVETVAEESGADPIDLSPLYERVDSGERAEVFASTSTELSRTGPIEFSYCGYAVTVDGDGEHAITLDEQSAD